MSLITFQRLHIDTNVPKERVSRYRSTDKKYIHQLFKNNRNNFFPFIGPVPFKSKQCLFRHDWEIRLMEKNSFEIVKEYY